MALETSTALITQYSVIGRQYGFRAYDKSGVFLVSALLDDIEGPAARDGEITLSMQAVSGAISYVVLEHFMLDTPSGWMEDGAVFFNPLSKTWVLCRRNPLEKSVAPIDSKTGDDIDLIEISEKDATQPEIIPLKPWLDITVVGGVFTRDEIIP